MMQLSSHKGLVKVVSIVTGLIFVGGVVAMGVTSVSSSSESGQGSSNIGYFDAKQVMSQDNPLYQKAGQEYQDFAQTTMTNAQQEMAAASDDATKQKIQQDANQKMQAKEQELLKNIQDKTEAAAKKVGDAKGLSVVMEKSSVLYGGVDITDQVLRKLQDDAK